MVNVAILGFGTVGSGVAEVLTDNAESIAEQCYHDYGWDYYFIFAGEEDYHIVCSAGLAR